MGADEWLHRINQWISMGFGSDVASAGQPTRHIFVLVLTVKTVRLGRSKSLGHVESSASRQLIRALQTDRKVNSYASRVTYLYRDLPWEKSKIIILSKKNQQNQKPSSKILQESPKKNMGHNRFNQWALHLHPAPSSSNEDRCQSSGGGHADRDRLRVEARRNGSQPGLAGWMLGSGWGNGWKMTEGLRMDKDG